MPLESPSLPAESIPVSATVEITHNRTEGTLLDAGRRLSREAVDAITGNLLTFRWSSTIDCWYIPHSRYKRHNKWAVDLAAERLRALGYAVSVDIDDLSPSPPFAQRETDCAEAAESRAERFAGYRDSAAQRAERASAAVDRLFGDSFGQPILVGHHSEKAHRGRLNRAWNLEFKGAEERAKVSYWQARAKASATWSDKRYDKNVTRRRLDREVTAMAESDKVSDETLLAWMVDLEQLHEEIGFWTAHIEALKKDGVPFITKDDVPKGAFVAFATLRGDLRWYEVIRANAKTVTLPHPYKSEGLINRKPAERGPQITMRYDEIVEVATADQLRERYGDVL